MEIRNLNFNLVMKLAMRRMRNKVAVQDYRKFYTPIGGIATVTMGFAWRMKINNNVAQTPCYKEALKTLRENRGAVYLLGEPIKDHLFDVGNTERNYTKDYSLHYEVPVKGSKERGVLHYWGERNTKDEEYALTRMELELKKEPNKRLLIKGTL